MSANKLLRLLFLRSNACLDPKAIQTQERHAPSEIDPLSIFTLKKFYVPFNPKPPQSSYQAISRKNDLNELYYSRHSASDSHLYFSSLFPISDTQLGARITSVYPARGTLNSRACSRANSHS